MKKQLGDMTLREVAEMCKDHTYCANCPLYFHCPCNTNPCFWTQLDSTVLLEGQLNISQVCYEKTT